MKISTEIFEIKKDLEIVFKSIAEHIFPTYKAEFKSPIDFGYDPTDDFSLPIGSFNHKIFSKKNRKLYAKITVRTLNGKEKFYRDKLVEFLKEKNIEMDIGERMSLSINVKDLLHEFRHLLSSTKSISKFKL